MLVDLSLKDQTFGDVTYNPLHISGLAVLIHQQSARDLGPKGCLIATLKL